jgi:dTDP-4-dehydrorhamnose 3,5-epimerase
MKEVRMIDGVIVKPLQKIPNESGCLYSMIDSNNAEFKGFGEIYFSLAYPGVVKGWHLHNEMILNYAVMIGMIKLVLYDDRNLSKTKGEVMEILLGETNYSLVQVPALVWNGFQGMGSPHSIVANCSTIPHRENEMMRTSPYSKEIPYNWNLSHG